MLETITPTEEGLVGRAGATISYQVYGERNQTHEPTLVFLPPFNVASAGTLYRSQIPHLSRRHRCVAYDALGTGGSSCTTDPTRLTMDQWIADMYAVLEAAAVDTFVAVGHSFGGALALLAAASFPDRVLGAAAISPAFRWEIEHPSDAWMPSFEEVRDTYSGWDWWNAHAIRSDYEGFHYFFEAQALHQTHPEAEIARAVELAIAESDPESVIAFIRSFPDESDHAQLEQVLSSISCPVVIIQGDEDRVVPLHDVQRTARAVGVEPTVLKGAAHALTFRRAPELNTHIDQWLQQFRTEPAQPCPPSSIRKSTAPRILYLSSPIGLGHVRRDVAIAGEIRRLAPGTEIEWLTQEPATSVLRAHGERIHPASALLVSENNHLNSHATDHGIDLSRALLTMDEILTTNYFVFHDVVASGDYDLVIGDEAWEVDTFWLDNPSAKQTRYAWISDFVGELALTELGKESASLCHARNARMVHNIETNPGVRDLSLFIGAPEDVVDNTFGPGLSNIGPWTDEHYEFTGYVTGFEPNQLPPQDELRQRFGVGADETLIVAAVGGSGIGGSLLHTMAATHRRLSQTRPDLRTILVTGPGVPTDQFPAMPGLDVRGWVPDLHHLLAVSDAAVVQGGLTTTMELTAAGRPFLYAPLEGHFEQQLHVHHRLRQHNAGQRIAHDSESEELSEMLDRMIGKPTAYKAVPSDGATRAAERLVTLL